MALSSIEAAIATATPHQILHGPSRFKHVIMTVKYKGIKKLRTKKLDYPSQHIVGLE